MSNCSSSEKLLKQHVPQQSNVIGFSPYTCIYTKHNSNIDDILYTCTLNIVVI